MSCTCLAPSISPGAPSGIMCAPHRQHFAHVGACASGELPGTAASFRSSANPHIG